jgi:hypothetical protein
MARRIPADNEVVNALPESLDVQFVDDDFVLRKPFVRALRKVAAGWTVHESSNGETA